MTQPTDQTPGVLTGIRVVEFAQNAAIPHCGRLLAGLGADVVKVEPPEGDAMRRLISLGEMESRAYALINPGKRSIAIDLGSPDSRAVVDALFEWADVALVALSCPTWSVTASIGTRPAPSTLVSSISPILRWARMAPMPISAGTTRSCRVAAASATS